MQTSEHLNVAVSGASKSKDSLAGQALNATRIQSVDAMRLIAIFAVICIHALPFPAARMDGFWSGWRVVGMAIPAVARFAVPFFFCISGYFWGQRIRRGTEARVATRAMFTRIMTIYIFWSAFYMLWSEAPVLVHILHPASSKAKEGVDISFLWHPLQLFHDGAKYHLWFLLALLCGLVFSHIFVACKAERLLVASSIVLYAIAVLGRAYANTPIGFTPQIAGQLIDTRDGLFSSTLFFVTGYLLSAQTPRSQWARYGLALLGGGLLLQGLEVWWIEAISRTSLPVERLDFVFGTYAMGVGATMLALASPAWLSKPAMARWGRLALGIYCVHVFFASNLARTVIRLHSPAVELLYPVVVLVLSAITVDLLARIKLTRRFVQ